MEKFFLEHHVMRDRDPDELRGRVASDSEASDEEEEISERVHSVQDATGPWRQTPVDGPWGDPQARKPDTKNRVFRSEHTGPKGVIKDYKAHKRYQREERERLEKERQAALLRIAKGTSVGSNQEAVGCSADECACDDDDDDDMLLNDDFLRKYNALRMYQMHQTARMRNRFGTLEYISPSEYVKLTDDSPSNVTIIVHLYHPESYSCGLMNQHLEQIATELSHVKFVAMVAHEADDSITMGDVPVLLVYRGQQLEETVVGVAEKLDGEFTADRIKQLVVAHTAEAA